MNQREAIQETFRRILRQTTLRALLRPHGRTPLDVTQQEADAMLEPFEQFLDTDHLMCCEVADQLVALERAGANAVELRQEEDTLTLSTDADPDS